MHSSRRVAVAMIGARRHYAVPRALVECGLLEQLYTDGWIGGSELLRRVANAVPARARPPWLLKALGRQSPDLPADRVHAFPWFALRYFNRRRRVRREAEMTATFLWAGRTFCEHVIRAGVGEADTVYTFNSAGLELQRWAGGRGLRRVMDQTIAPRAVVDRLLREERERHPQWAEQPNGVADPWADEYAARERAEWAESDVIVCGSDFVREGIATEGGPAEKVVVVPSGIEGGLYPRANERQRTTGLHVLFVGEVGLRKGIAYLVDAARQLDSDRISVRAVGSLPAARKAVDHARKWVQFTGRIPRQHMAEMYAWADVFVLPSICEGSAMVCYEALSAGLPVITTPNAGSVVRDGLDGYIVPVRDAEAIAGRLDLLASDAELLAELSRNALAHASTFTMRAYAQRLAQAVQGTPGT